MPAAPAGCVGHTLPVSDPATGLTQTIGREIQQRTQLAKQVSSANATIMQYDTTIRDECNGASGPGLSGVPGAGPNCNRDRQQEDSFKKENNVVKWQQQLTDLNAKIEQQTATVGTQTQTYSNDVTNAINANVVARQTARAGSGCWTGSARWASSSRPTRRSQPRPCCSGCSSSWWTACQCCPR